MRFSFILLLIWSFSVGSSQALNNQEKAEAWMETIVEEQSQLKTRVADLQTQDSTYIREVFDKQGELESQEVNRSALSVEDGKAYFAYTELRGGEIETDISISTPEEGCYIFKGEVEMLSEESLKSYQTSFSNPIDLVTPFIKDVSSIEYVGEFSVPGIISGHQVDYLYGDEPMSYIFDDDGSVLGSLDGNELTVYLGLEATLVEGSGLNYDEYILGDTPRLNERSRVIEYAENETLDESLFDCPAAIN